MNAARTSINSPATRGVSFAVAWRSLALSIFRIELKRQLPVMSKSWIRDRRPGGWRARRRAVQELVKISYRRRSFLGLCAGGRETNHTAREDDAHPQRN